MAKPDLDDGYLRVAHELFAAIALAGFSKWEMVVLREVFDQIYGPAKSKVARLSPTDVATRAGTYKESIVRAIRTLVAAGILVKTAEGEYRFIKDYDAWRHGERPRFSPSESTYCASAKRIKASTPDGNNGAPTHKRIRGTSALPTGTDALPDGEQMRSPSGTDALPVGNRCAPVEVVPPRPPIEERARSEKAEEGLRNGLPACQPDFSSSCDPTLSEADRIGEQVEEWFPGAGWGVKAFEMCRQFSSASVEWGFRTAYAKSLRGERISYRRVVGLVNFAEENPMSAEVRGPAQPARAAPAPQRSAPTYSDDQKAEIARKLKERTAKHASRCG